MEKYFSTEAEYKKYLSIMTPVRRRFTCLLKKAMVKFDRQSAALRREYKRNISFQGEHRAWNEMQQKEYVCLNECFQEQKIVRETLNRLTKIACSVARVD